VMRQFCTLFFNTFLKRKKNPNPNFSKSRSRITQLKRDRCRRI
jgi:hypothetical protein